MSRQTIFEKPTTVTPNGNCLNNKHIDSSSVDVKLNDVFRNTVTQKEAENLAKCAVSPDAELVDYYLRPYSEEKLGFLGMHLCLSMVIERPGSSECERYSFFVKTLPYDVPDQVAYIEEKGVFRKEADFFKILQPILTKNFRGESWAPRCYLAKDDALIFEDMKFRGFANRPKLFDERTTRAAIACLARMHASSLLAEERLNGKLLIDLYADLLKEAEFKRTSRCLVWYTVAIDLAVVLAEELGYDPSQIRRASECVFELGVPSRTKRNVLSHGDLWGSNMIFDADDRCNLVDFQLIRYAPLTHDVMQLLHLTTSRVFRRQHERRMLEHYYATLRETLADNDFKGLVPSFEEVLEGAEEQRLPAVVTAMMFHPTVLMDGITADKVMGDPVTYEAYYFTKRKPFVDEIMAANPEYEWRIKEDVRELAEMSLVLDNLPSLT